MTGFLPGGGEVGALVTQLSHLYPGISWETAGRRLIAVRDGGAGGLQGAEHGIRTDAGQTEPRAGSVFSTQ